MESKFFVGLILKSNTPSAKRILDFRNRFDPKSVHFKYLHLSLLPPFLAKPAELKSLIADIDEDVQSFFHSTTHDLDTLRFEKLNVFHGHSKILYLEPNLPTDLDYLKESLSEILYDLVPDYKRKYLKEKCFLSLGRFFDPTMLNFAIERALGELHLPLAVEVDSLCLFEKKDSQWRVKEKFMDFQTMVNPFLGEKVAF